MDNPRLSSNALVMLALPALLAAAGCGPSAKQEITAVPAPIDCLLPQSVELGPWLRMDPTIPGIEVMARARDSFGDVTKAFGDFRFELHGYRSSALDKRGKQLAVWDVPLGDGQANRVHWEDIHRAYKFRLKWEGQSSGRYVMTVYFQSPFTKRLMDQRTFTAEGLR